MGILNGGTVYSLFPECTSSKRLGQSSSMKNVFVKKMDFGYQACDLLALKSQRSGIWGLNTALAFRGIVTSGLQEQIVHSVVDC
jgi:hypothetical protein